MVNIPFVSGELSIEAYINALYLLAISVAAVMAVLKITIAGVKYMLDDVVTHKQEAKKEIVGALFGLLIVLAAVVILNTINPQLTTFDILATGRTGEPTSANFIPRDSSSGRSLPTNCDGNSTVRANIVENASTGMLEVAYDCVPRVSLNQNMTATAERYLEILEEIDSIGAEEARTAEGQARLRALRAELQGMVDNAGQGGGGGNGGGAGSNVDPVGTGICANRDPGDVVVETSDGESCPVGSVFQENRSDGIDAVTGSCVCPNT